MKQLRLEMTFEKVGSDWKSVCQIAKAKIRKIPYFF